MQEMQETQVRSLGQEDLLGEEMATYSNILALETNREIILLFLRLHPSTASQTLLLTMMVTPFLLSDSSPQ